MWPGGDSQIHIVCQMGGDVRERQRNKRHKECGGRGQDFKCQEASSIRWLLSRHRKGVSPVDGGQVRSREREQQVHRP